MPWPVKDCSAAFSVIHCEDHAVSNLFMVYSIDTDVAAGV